MMHIHYKARGFKKILSCFLLNILALCSPCFAADIRLTLGHASVDDQVTVTLENRSSMAVMVKTVYIELDGKRYEQSFGQEILSRQKREFRYHVTYPAMPGAYPLTSAVQYMNDGRLLSLKHTAMYNYREAAPLDLSCTIEGPSISDKGDIILRSSQPRLWRLILPDEITLTGATELPDRTVFHVRTAIPDLQCNYAFFAVAEKVSDNRHCSALASGTLSVSPPRTEERYARGRMPSRALTALAALFLIVWLCMPNRHRPHLVPSPAPRSAGAKGKNNQASPKKGIKGFIYRFQYIPQTLAVPAGKKAEEVTPKERAMRAVAKYSCRMFFLTSCYLLLKNAYSWFDYLQGHIGWETARYLFKVASDNLSGSNYEYFFKYFVDWYWGAAIVLTLPYLYWRDGETPIERDKYASFLATLCTIGRVFRGRAPFWNYTSRLGMLTLFVKVFYIPYLTSWVINNTFHQQHLIHTFSWNPATVNVFLVALFIYIDTIVFSFGYVFEAGFLKNKIRSVEPTLFGWAVCLWCYPPFNVLSYKPFDRQLIDIAHTYPGWVQISMTCMISFLWGIFAWASVSLGFKGSNLTNRGIVASGPYRFCRHPAYAAKITVWIIQGIIFAEYTTGILLGFMLIYFLRAWTEERHLSLDPDYLAYKKKVRWRFLPGVM
jgi:protein-S-isoprenylcysteine O-methyltransferase Ste14